MGTFAAWLGSTLDSPGAAASNWTLDVPAIPAGDYVIIAGAIDTAGNLGATSQHPVTVAQSQPPTVPTGVATSTATSSTITVGWAPSTDDTSVSHYRIFRDGVFVGETTHPETTFRDQYLNTATGYSYRVSAVDADGNESAQSPAAFLSSTGIEPILLSDIADPTWEVDGIVHTLLTIGDVVYIGGEFNSLSSVGSTVARNNLAAIDRVTGAPLPFDPDLDGIVNAVEISPDGQTLYVGGQFDHAGGIDREHLAAFLTADGSLSPFDPPSTNTSIRAIATDGETLYIGGTFTRVGGIDRVRLAAYDIQTETLTNWQPSANNLVKDLIVDPDRVWVAGNFSTFNNTALVGLAAVDRDAGTLIPTDHPIFPVLDISALGNQIFAAGAGPGGRTAAYDRTTGAEQWIHSTNGNVQAVEVIGNFAYFGGHYNMLSGTEVDRLTRHDITTGELDINWLPDINGVRSVNALEIDDDNVYIGGDFTAVSSIGQRGFAQFSRKSITEIAPRFVEATMFDTDANGYVDTVEVTFDQNLAVCPGNCTAGWDLQNVPSGGTLNFVTVNQNVATLHLVEGIANEPDTGVGSFEIKLERAGAIRSTFGHRSKFPYIEPMDGAQPMAVDIRRVNASGGTSGLAERGDEFIIEWSEKLDRNSLPSSTTVTVADLADGLNDQLTIVGVTNGALDLGSDGFLACAGGPCAAAEQAVFNNSNIGFANNTSLVEVTLGTCSGACNLLTAQVPDTTFTFVPAPTITDVSNNSSTGSITKTFPVF